MNMKKTTAIILSAALALSLAGCANSSSGNRGSGGNYGNTGNNGGTTAKTERVSDKTITLSYTGDTLSGTYTGEWENGKANGEGQFNYSGKYSLVIDGTFKNGEPVNGSFLEKDSDGREAFYVGKLVNGQPNDTNAYFECEIDGVEARYQGSIRNNRIDGQGDLTYIMDDGSFVRFIGNCVNNNPINGDYQIYNANGKLVESGKVINGESRTDASLAVENIVDNIGRKVEQHFGFNGLYDSLKKALS